MMKKAGLPPAVENFFSHVKSRNVLLTYVYNVSDEKQRLTGSTLNQKLFFIKNKNLYRFLVDSFKMS